MKLGRVSLCAICCLWKIYPDFHPVSELLEENTKFINDLQKLAGVQ